MNIKKQLTEEINVRGWGKEVEIYSNIKRALIYVKDFHFLDFEQDM